MIFRYTFILACTLLLVCCKKVDEHAEQINVVFGECRNTPFAMSQLIDSVYYVVLDSACTVGHIDEIKYVDSIFYLIDKNEGSIHSFDHSGKFLQTVKHKGRARNEYIQLSDATISSSTRDISVYDAASNSVIRYSPSGDLKYKFTMTDVIRDFEVLPNGDYLLYTPDFNGTSNRGLWQIDSCGALRRQLVEIDEDFRYGGVYPSYFTSIGNNTFGLMGGEDSDNIYHISQDTFSVYRNVKFNISIPKSITQETTVDIERHKGRIYTKRDYKESTRWLMFSATDFENVTICFYDKKNDRVYLLNSPEDIDEDCYMATGMDYWFGDISVGILYPDLVESSERLHGMFPYITRDSNPILCMVRLSQ